MRRIVAAMILLMVPVRADAAVKPPGTPLGKTERTTLSAVIARTIAVRSLRIDMRSPSRVRC